MVQPDEPGVADVGRAIAQLLVDVEIGSLATIAEDGSPHTSIMHFAGDGFAVYCHTYTYTRKFAHLQRDPRVSYALAWIPPDGFYGRDQLRSIQVSGTAEIVTDPDESQHAIEVSRAQFDWLKDANIFAAFNNPHPAMRNVFFKVTPVRAMWSDNRVRMLWRTLVSFDSGGSEITTLEPYPGVAAG